MTSFEEGMKRRAEEREQKGDAFSKELLSALLLTFSGAVSAERVVCQLGDFPDEGKQVARTTVRTHFAQVQQIMKTVYPEEPEQDEPEA